MELHRALNHLLEAEASPRTTQAGDGLGGAWSVAQQCRIPPRGGDEERLRVWAVRWAPASS